MTESQPSGFAAAVAAVTDPDPDAGHAARARQQRLAIPAGSLGRLAELAVWAAGVQGSCPPADFATARAVLFAAD
ncbi:MAG TPA: nicotinate-nucleotide--dimethylbenzimidazole phosphoribosyltransferase, partial [Jatrophihabitans sp.]|nr:nicotinate-nucleotide--dimethylbenzimidazole phosphoribosyltransferase [Jatrophihabitans sp.]